jgi:hypothetical protein
VDSLPTKQCQFNHGTGKICLKEYSLCSCSVAAISAGKRLQARAPRNGVTCFGVTSTPILSVEAGA